MIENMTSRDWERLATLRQDIISKLERKIRRLESKLEDTQKTNQENI